MKKADIQFVTALICDDVRKETTGKDILIGVYSSNIAVASIPSELNIVFYIMAHTIESGSIEVKFRMIGPNTARLFETPVMGIEITNLDSGSIIFGTTVQFQAEGKYVIQGSKDDGKTWTDIREIPVNLSSNIQAS